MRVTYVFDECNNYPEVDWSKYGFEPLKTGIYTGDVECLFVGCETVDDETLKDFPKLKVIGTRTTNTENIKISKPLTIFKLEKEDVLDFTATAEHTVFLMLSLAKKAHMFRQTVESGKVVHVQGNDLRNKTIGIFGYGRIGKAVAHTAYAMGMKIQVYKRDQESKDHMLKTCDVISLHLPARDEFKDFLSFEDFEKMKESAIVINTARPYMINHIALLHALETRQVRGIAMDYTSYTDDSEIDKSILDYARTYGNFIVTPHVAGSTYETKKLAAERVVKRASEYVG